MSNLKNPGFRRCIGAFLVLAIFPVVDCGPADPELVQSDIWVSGTGGYHTYRIPSLVTASDGTLLAFCEGRKYSRSDTGDIDLLIRRSPDNGVSWSPTEVIWDDGPNTCGNPCPVVDNQTGAISLLMTHNPGTDKESEIIGQTSQGTRTVWLARSQDNGLNWSKPIEITSHVKQENWTWYATGPGAGIQIRHGANQGRLVIPCDHIEAATKRYYSHVIYSDDYGESWQLGGSSPQDEVNECEVVELAEPAGRLLLNMRNYDRTQHTRQVAVSDDGGMSWNDQRHSPSLVEPICQASIRRIRWPVEGKPGLILFSNPASRTNRSRMTIRASYDDSESWPLSQLIYEGSSAYSCLTTLPDHNVGLLYERDDYGRITFVRLPVFW